MSVHPIALCALGLALLAGSAAAIEAARADDGVEPRVCQMFTKGTAEEWQQFLDEFKAAAAVFTGMTVEVDRVTVRFKADWFWKSEPKKDITLLTGMPAEPNAWREDVFEFEQGRQYLVFAYKDPSGGMTTNACSRTALTTAARDDIRALERIVRHKVAK
jgi:hypothetical protein